MMMSKALLTVERYFSHNITTQNQKLSTFEGERNKKIVSKKIFSNGYAITCTGIDGKRSFISKFYAINLRNNVQLRFILKYPSTKKDEFEKYLETMLNSIEAH
jgi:hypothetical protein